MNKKLIIHIPHSGTSIPLLDGFIENKIVIEKEISKLTDWYTDELFNSEEDEMIIPRFSRIFCDPERFKDDEFEIMSQIGMGVLYEKTDEGNFLRKVTPELRQNIIANYYDKHHQQLSQAVKRELDVYGKAIIVDGHSYPSIPLKRDLSQIEDRPDFNIGTDSFHTPVEMVEFSESFFKKHGYSLGIDWPYKGTIVPMEYYYTNKNVSSIMLEINRKLYMNESSIAKSDNFTKINKITQEYINELKKRFL
jgi:N-formylglutamate amidohydrolase